MSNKEQKTLRLILGDQLNLNHSWFREINPNVIYVLMEVRQETDYVVHHIQKVLAFFAAMRYFAGQLRDIGHTIHYIKLNSPNNLQSFSENLTALIEKFAIGRFEYQLPDEFRVDQQLKTFCDALKIPWAAVDSEHFLTGRSDLQHHFAEKKQYLMESFYRMMRKRYNILLDGEKPVGGKWNFDVQNRRKYDGAVPVPNPILFHNEIADLKTLLTRMKVNSFGECSDSLLWPINREQSLQAMRFFIENGLPHFGTYQDAMATSHWALFHARLSFALNTKMIHPMEVIEAAIHTRQENKSEIELHQLEGFVRQILGWREYVRGIYWAHMPGYSKMNFFNNTRPLPHFYWDGDTKMQCMKYVIRQSVKYAYAHHIQRLMVTGNFAQIAGIHPDAVDAWYLGIYIDAIEWVEITNTRGMSQFADGGLMATKPYNSTANYIHKMSDYCQDCFYDRKKKYGDRACPFNSLYWAFYFRHRDKLAANPRIGMMYRVMDRFEKEEFSGILKQAEYYIEHIEEL